MPITEERFAEKIQGKNLTEADIYILRVDMGLPAQKPSFVPSEDTELGRTSLKALRMRAWAKLG